MFEGGRRGASLKTTEEKPIKIRYRSKPNATVMPVKNRWGGGEGTYDRREKVHIRQVDLHVPAEEEPMHQEAICDHLGKNLASGRGSWKSLRGVTKRGSLKEKVGG